MMTSLDALLTLPKPTTGFTVTRPSAIEASLDDGSASPPRKVARLSVGPDFASASRSKAPTTADARSVFIVNITGESDNRKPTWQTQMHLVRKSIINSLDRHPDTSTPRPTNAAVYNACRAIVTAGHDGETLYGHLCKDLESGIRNLVQSLLQEKEEGLSWVSALTESLSWLQDRIQRLQSLLTYLDQVYVPSRPDAKSVRELAYEVINDRVFGNAQVAERLRRGILHWVTTERENGTVHPQRTVIITLIEHLLAHKQYSAIEDFYLRETRAYYEAKSTSLGETYKDNWLEFFSRASTFTTLETNRSQEVLPVISWDAVREATEEALWHGKTAWIANEGVPCFVRDRSFPPLGVMYALLSRVGGVKEMCVAFRTYLQTSVTEIVKDADHDDKMIERLLDLRRAANDAVSQAFLTDKSPAVSKSSSTLNKGSNDNASTSELPAKIPHPDFVSAINDAFTYGFRARRNKPAEMIAKYLDKLMRKGQGASTDEAFNASLDAVLALCRHTDDKDVFRTFYHRSLAKRLLLDKSASDDFEKKMLEKLTKDYDSEFGNAEDMFKDLSLSKELTKDWHARLKLSDPARSLNAFVLQRSAWPFSSLTKQVVDLPPKMQDQITKFTEYYKHKHTGRVLSWDPALGTAILEGRFERGSKTLSVSLYQALVLLLFNEVSEISYAEIRAQTNMETEELKRTLLSLSYSKNKNKTSSGRSKAPQKSGGGGDGEGWDDTVLRKVPPGKEVAEDDVFEFNPNFWDARKRVHINSIQAKVSPEESRRTNHAIEEDRKFSLDAAIVRVMKARKEMTFELLKAATIDAVKHHFVPDVGLIKLRIEAMVEQEYLERDGTEKGLYRYLA